MFRYFLGKLSWIVFLYLAHIVQQADRMHPTPLDAARCILDFFSHVKGYPLPYNLQDALHVALDRMDRKHIQCVKFWLFRIIMGVESIRFCPVFLPFFSISL